MKSSKVNHYYVYIHKRLSDGLVFYVGKGTGRRAFSSHGKSRSIRWHRTVEKHGFSVEIVKENMPEKCALTLEAIYISKYRSLGMPLVNHKKTGDCSNEWNAKKVYSSDGRSWDSAASAARSLKDDGVTGADQSLISMCARGVRRHAAGMAWSYDGVPDAPTGMRLQGREIYSSCGMTFACMKDAVLWLRDNGWPNAHHSAISTACKNPDRVSYDRRWSADKVPEPPERTGKYVCSEKTIARCAKPCISSFGEAFESAADAARQMRVSGYPNAGVQSISAACTGKQKTAYGREWSYTN